MNLRITAYLKANEAGCQPSTHFKDHFINNDHLHPKVKTIPIEEELALTEPEVVVLDGHTPIKTIRGNELLRPDLLQEYLRNL